MINHNDGITPSYVPAEDIETSEDIARLGDLAQVIQGKVNTSAPRIKSVSMRFSADGSVFVSVTSTHSRYFGNPYRGARG